MTPGLEKQLRHLIEYLGWSLIPILPETKTPAIKWLDNTEKRASFDEVKRWVKRGWHLAVVTGDISGVMIVDDDRVKHGLKEYGFDSPVVSQSKSGGRHYYYPYDREVHSHANGEIFVDLKAWHSYCLIPPFNGRIWIKAPQKRSMEILIETPLKQEIVDLINSDKKGEYEKIEPTEFIDVKEGERTAKLYQLACSLFNTYSLDDGKRILFGINQTYSPPVSEKEFEYNVARAWKYVQDNPKIKVDLGQLSAVSDNLTDITKCTEAANGERLAEWYGDTIRFDHRRNRWLVWEGHRWVPDALESAKKLVLESARKQYQEASNIDDTKIRGRVANWAISSESRSRVENTLALARAFDPIADDGRNWDSDPNLISCRNGIFDIKSRELRQGEPGDKTSLVSSVEYDREAKCPRWEKFIDEVFGGDKELVRWVQKALGYSITGSMVEQAIFFGYGSGSNGKSVLFSTVREVLGEYAYDAPSQTFTKNQSTNTNDLASLEFKRFVVSSETLTTSKLNEQRLKALSGGDRANARFLHQEFFEFQPMCKIWLFLNHRPQVEDDSFAFWRRVRCIPFTQTFTGAKADPLLAEKLKEEKPGIFNWLVEGCRLWQAEGLQQIPEKIKESTDDYRSENDDLFEFVSEFCLIGDNLQVGAAELYRAYIEWCESYKIYGSDRYTVTNFGRKMSDKYPKNKTMTGAKYQGIGLRKSPDMTGLGKNLGTHDGLDPLLPLEVQLDISRDINSKNTLNPSYSGNLGTNGEVQPVIYPSSRHETQTTDQMDDSEINNILGL